MFEFIQFKIKKIFYFDLMDGFLLENQVFK
jgi:hypothetical protein